MTYEDALAAARRGAALLDEKEPGWRKRIRLKRLDMEDECLCVLGQVFGFYWDGLRALALIPRDDDWEPWDHVVEVAHGFDAPYESPEQEQDYAILDKAWREVLAS